MSPSHLGVNVPERLRHGQCHPFTLQSKVPAQTGRRGGNLGACVALLCKVAGGSGLVSGAKQGPDMQPHAPSGAGAHSALHSGLCEKIPPCQASSHFLHLQGPVQGSGADWVFLFYWELHLPLPPQVLLGAVLLFSPVGVLIRSCSLSGCVVHPCLCPLTSPTSES